MIRSKFGTLVLSWCLLSVVAALTIMPGLALAQQTGTDSVRVVLRRLEQRNAYIRVAVDSTVTEGLVRRVTESDFIVGGTPIQINAVDRIERRVTRGGGTVAGALAGGIALGVVWLSLASDPDSGGGKDIGSLLGGFGIGAGIGMLIGYIVNPGKREWKTL